MKEKKTYNQNNFFKPNSSTLKPVVHIENQNNNQPSLLKGNQKRKQDSDELATRKKKPIKKQKTLSPPILPPLPKELWMHISRFLPAKDALNLSLTEKRHRILFTLEHKIERYQVIHPFLFYIKSISEYFDKNPKKYDEPIYTSPNQINFDYPARLFQMLHYFYNDIILLNKSSIVNFIPTAMQPSTLISAEFLINKFQYDNEEEKNLVRIFIYQNLINEIDYLKLCVKKFDQVFAIPHNMSEEEFIIKEMITSINKDLITEIEKINNKQFITQKHFWESLALLFFTENDIPFEKTKFLNFWENRIKKIIALLSSFDKNSFCEFMNNKTFIRYTTIWIDSFSTENLIEQIKFLKENRHEIYDFYNLSLPTRPTCLSLLKLLYKNYLCPIGFEHYMLVKRKFILFNLDLNLLNIEPIWVEKTKLPLSFYQGRETGDNIDITSIDPEVFFALNMKEKNMVQELNKKIDLSSFIFSFQKIFNNVFFARYLSVFKRNKILYPAFELAAITKFSKIFNTLPPIDLMKSQVPLFGIIKGKWRSLTEEQKKICENREFLISCSVLQDETITENFFEKYLDIFKLMLHLPQNLRTLILNKNILFEFETPRGNKNNNKVENNIISSFIDETTSLFIGGIQHEKNYNLFINMLKIVTYPPLISSHENCFIFAFVFVLHLVKLSKEATFYSELCEYNGTTKPKPGFQLNMNFHNRLKIINQLNHFLINEKAFQSCIELRNKTYESYLARKIGDPSSYIKNGFSDFFQNSKISPTQQQALQPSQSPQYSTPTSNIFRNDSNDNDPDADSMEEITQNRAFLNR